MLWPPQLEIGLETGELVEALDLFPTLVDLAGLLPYLYKV